MTNVNRLEKFRWVKARGYMFTEERHEKATHFIATFVYKDGEWHMHCVHGDSRGHESMDRVLGWDSIFRHIGRVMKES